MQTRALELEAHVRNLEASRRRGEWAMARVALDRCLQVVEAEGSDIPTEWRLWRVEIELSRGNWDGANSAAKCVHFKKKINSSLSCAAGRPLILLIDWIVTRCGCSQIHLTCSLSAGSFYSFVDGSRRRCNMLSRRCDSTLVTSLHNVCASA